MLRLQVDGYFDLKLVRVWYTSIQTERFMVDLQPKKTGTARGNEEWIYASHFRSAWDPKHETIKIDLKATPKLRVKKPDNIKKT